MNKYKKLVSNTLIFAIGSFGSKILLLLLTRLYTGNINPGDNSTKELLEQTANFLIPIITFSIGNLAFALFFPENTAYINVSPPTRPIYISSIRTYREILCKEGVIPSVSPTVPMADAASKRLPSIGSPSAELITIPPARNIIKYNIAIDAAFLIT